MTDLEKLITELCELPSLDLVGNDNLNIRWCTRNPNKPFVLLECEWGDSVYLDPAQALALLEWLKDQRGNLEELQEALRAQQIQDEAAKEQREAERINALKALHSDAVVAWQQGGCAGPCPSFEDIVIREQLVRHDLVDETSIMPLFVKEFSMAEYMRLYGNERKT